MTKTEQRYAHLYAEKRVDAAGLARAVARGLLTQGVCDEILAREQSEAQEPQTDSAPSV